MNHDGVDFAYNSGSRRNSSLQSFERRTKMVRRKTNVVRLAAALAAGAMFNTAKADNIINLFDNASEVPQWAFNFGGANHVESFSTDDAGGSPTSGSLNLQLTFEGSGSGNQNFAYQRNAFFP